MLYPMIQPRSFHDSGEKDFSSVFLPYIGKAVIFYDDRAFEQIVNIFSTEGPI